MVGGDLRQKLFPDATKKTYKKAVEWEIEKRKEMEKDQTATVSLTILPWSDEYLDYAKDCFTQKTYKEKKSAYKRLLHFFDPQMFLSDICPA